MNNLVVKNPNMNILSKSTYYPFLAMCTIYGSMKKHVNNRNEL